MSTCCSFTTKSKDVGEDRILTFDYSTILPTGVTLSSIFSVAFTVVQGTDTNPGALNNGPSVIDITGTMIQQPITGGVKDVTYHCKAFAYASNGEKLECSGNLLVLDR